MIAKFAKISLSVILMLGMLTFANAKEPTNWFFGAGIGAGLSKIDKNYPTAAGNTIGITWVSYTPNYSSSISDWGLLGKFLVDISTL